MVAEKYKRGRESVIAGIYICTLVPKNLITILVPFVHALIITDFNVFVSCCFSV